jgi:hypothetical protein
MTNDELKAALESLAAKHAFTVTKNGKAWDVKISVVAVDKKQGMTGFSISVPCNYYVSKKDAVEVIIAIRKELASMPGAVGTRKALKLDIPGLWHMGHFSPDCVASRHYAVE